MEPQIETGVPIPRIRQRSVRHGKWKSIFSAMNVGDSVFVPKRKFSLHSRYARELGRRFIVRSEQEGLRIWRVE